MDWTNNYEAIQVELGVALNKRELQAISDHLKASEDQKFRELASELATTGTTLVDRINQNWNELED